ncbi:hypothetical protein [Bradyrhizobium genosp. P]
MKSTLEELQALRLVRAFCKIKDPDKRKEVLDYVEAQARPEKK